AITACAANFSDCNSMYGDGCEVNVATSNGQSACAIQNCGACGSPCSCANMATVGCNAGNCAGSCNANFADCDSKLRTQGCEWNLQNATNTFTNTTQSGCGITNCGSCGGSCSCANMATTTCNAGNCAGACNANFAD